MPLFRFTLDGNLLADEPEGWQDIISELKRDKAIGGQVLIMDLTVSFLGGTDGYNILKPNMDCNGFCSFSELKIEQSCEDDFTFVTIYEGILFYTDIKEHLLPCVLECKLTDNSYFAKISNNKNIEAFVNVGRSKNDVAIFAASITQPLFFDVPTGVYSSPVNVWSVYECFRFIVAYMTDGEMGFVSDYFNPLSGTVGGSLTITTGEQISLGSGGAPTKVPFISFQKLFDEVNKKFNIGFSVETIFGVKTLRIEPKSYFFNQNVSVALNNIKGQNGIVKSVDTSQLYAKLTIGSNDVNDYAAGTNDFPTDIVFIGFNKESFTLTGKCNIDAELNLVSDWIIDSNIIQSTFAGNADHDDDIFFIMVDPGGVNAKQSDPFLNAPPYFYNGDLRNSEVIVRWFGAVPNSIALYLNNANNEFMASSISDVAFATICAINTPYQDDFNPPNFDASGNYNNGTYEYTAPATGLYSFQVISRVFYAEDTGTLTQIIFTDLMVNAVSVVNYQDFIPHGNSVFSYIFSNIYLYAGDVVNIRTSDLFCFPNNPPFYTLSLLADSTFACINASVGGGIFQYFNPEDFKAFLYEFDFPLTFADYQTIISNPLKLIAFNDGRNFIEAYIDRMKYNHKLGNANFICINSLKKTNC